MRILVTNDDGIDAPGIHALAEALAELGDVVVSAPDGNRSASAHSLTLDHPLRIQQVRPGWFACDGTPADCVHVALNGFLRDERPLLVVAGINAGGNLGQDITYSGTVMAALEATLLGVPAFAVSVDARTQIDYSGAVAMATRVARRVLANGLPPTVLLNLNVPSASPEQIKGIKLTRQGRRLYGDEIDERMDPRGREYYWIGGQELGFEQIDGSDMVAVRQGFASLTPISADLTDHSYLEKMMDQSW
ncbi:MAG: 5'/3'-nucleotidase SurE [Candidatus Lernaella stagnicola]|nr:5'/3'-nucleotidase SurE [Candidatus Lernaella stagnicola]